VETSCPPKGRVGAATLWRGFKFLFGSREISFTVNRREAQEYAREKFAKLLREPFPGASDAEIARQWAPRLQRSERIIKMWLACETSASIEDIFIVGATHGVWATAQIVVGEERREDVLNRIGQR
jgi:hypothetical protein